MVELAACAPQGTDHLQLRALNQAARELLLAQSRLGLHHEDGHRRALRRRSRQGPLACSATSIASHDRPDRRAWLADLERRDNIFPEIDYRTYA